jgi:5-methylthioadenosine/S-adenosylhomocysteine deaminase
MSLLIKDVQLGPETTNIYVEGNRIAEIGRAREADVVIEGRHKLAIPGLVNLHTHAAMTLFRGFGDDLNLRTWLETRIWPHEAKLRPEDIYWGTKLACLEMIKTGTTTFNDMYFHMDQVGKAVKEMGLRAVLAEGLIDGGEAGRGQEALKRIQDVNRKIEALKTDRITPALAPHAVYTVSKESFLAVKEVADKKGYLIHTHLDETQQEVDDCLARTSLRPAQYLDQLGVLIRDLVAAHACWLDAGEIDLMAKAGAKIAHCPVSNMKLSTGQAMPYAALRDAGVVMGLGTDGAATNNNLDMFESMKVAALLQKHAAATPTVLPAAEAFEMATLGGARALGLDVGLIEVGRLADLILVDLRRPEMVPRHSDLSNLVYAGHGNIVDTVICDGAVLMKGRRVKGEAEILEKASAVAKGLVSRE